MPKNNTNPKRERGRISLDSTPSLTLRVGVVQDALTSWITPVLPDETPSVGPIPISLDGKSPNATVRAWVGHVSDHILATYTRVLDGLSQSEFSGFRPQRRQPDRSPSPKDSES